MISNKCVWGAWLMMVAALSGSIAVAQDDPFASDDEPTPEPSAESAPAEPKAEPPDAPVEPAQEPPDLAPEGSVEASANAELSLSATSLAIDSSAEAAAADVPPPDAPVMAGSHIRRPRLSVDGASIINSPLRTDVQGREFLDIRRQLGGVAVPDVAAALRHGGAGTGQVQLRLQPTLVLLNGRRMVSAPFMGLSGNDFVDINQVPIQLIERVELTSGHAAGLYGEGAMGGVVNFVTRRDIDGIDIELGAQGTDRFDQGEADVSVMLGTGKGKSGANLMLSYFNRQPLAASDRDWLKGREDRIESLLGYPATFQPFVNFDYPLADPYCPVSQEVGHSNGFEVRLRGYGPPGNLPLLTPEQQQRFLTSYDQARGLIQDRGNGVIDPRQSPTFCATDYTVNNDFILKDERLQAYSTFWHGLSDHTEVYGEAGYYRSENENRTAPAFPIIRLTPSTAQDRDLFISSEHPDQPVNSYGFAGVETMAGRVANDLFLVGRTQGTFNGDGTQSRRVDVFRGVLGIKGDLKGIAPNSILSSWDWDVSGVYSTSELLSRVNDTNMDNLRQALNSCPATKLDPGTFMQVPTTIKERQNAGCFNPFYSSVINNAAINPLNVSARSAQASAAGFITSDTDTPNSVTGFGAQDGGYICDPNDPNSPPCPELNRDFDGDGLIDPWPAGQPNTQQTIDFITGQHFEYQRRVLATVDAGARGKLADIGSDGALSFAIGSQYRRESLLIDYDQAYNERQYAFLFGADDLDPVNRDVVAGHVELRLSLAGGLLEVQPAARIEAYDTVGVGMNGLLGASFRPFANSKNEALEYLGIRAHVGYGEQAPTLTQLYGQVNQFMQVDYRGATAFLAHQVSGNTNLDFEKYTTLSAGPQWDYAGIHVGADFWMTFIKDVITFDNSRTLVHDCRAQFEAGNERCSELVFLPRSDTLDHIESRFDNMAEVDTNGVDGSISYTLDTKRRGLGDFGTFFVGAQGTFINSYLIRGPRVLQPFFRDGAPAIANPESHSAADYLAPEFNADGTRNYDNLSAEYEAAGYRNMDNFAPPIPKLRFSVPVRWMYEGHTLGATVRFIDGYFDDSEYTIERQSLPGINQIQFYDGERISAWTVLDALYAFDFSGDAWKGTITVGVINLLDAVPPAVESPLGYEVGIHDPRGRTIYARVAGDF